MLLPYSNPPNPNLHLPTISMKRTFEEFQDTVFNEPEQAKLLRSKLYLLSKQAQSFTAYDDLPQLCLSVTTLAQKTLTTLVDYQFEGNEKSWFARQDVIQDLTASFSTIQKKLHQSNFSIPEVPLILNTLNHQYNQTQHNIEKKWGRLYQLRAETLSTEETSVSHVLREAISVLDKTVDFVSDELAGDNLLLPIKFLLAELISFRNSVDVEPPLFNDSEMLMLNAFIDEVDQLYQMTMKIYELDLSQRLHHPINISNELEDVIYWIQSQIDNLKPGQELAIPGGFYWSEKEGHANLYLIKRCDTDRDSFPIYTFTIIDNGFLGGNIKDDNCVDLSLSNLSYNEISGHPFLENLIKFTITSKPLTSRQHLITTLLGNLSRSSFESGLQHEAGKNENCGYFALSIWTNRRLGNKIYNQFKLLSKRKMIDRLKNMKNSTNPQILQEINKIKVKKENREIHGMEIVDLLTEKVYDSLATQLYTNTPKRIILSSIPNHRSTANFVSC